MYTTEVEATERKRKRAPIVNVVQNFIKRNTTIKTVSAIFCYENGMKAREVVKVSGEWTQDSVDDAVEAIVGHLQREHFAQLDGEWVLAYKHCPDMFAIGESESGEDELHGAQSADDEC